MKYMLFWRIGIFSPKVWMKLEICLNGCLAILNKFNEVGCASKMSFLHPCAFYARSYYEEQFMESCASSPQSLEKVLALCDSCQSSNHDIKFCLHVIFIDLRLEQLQQEIENYREVIENMTNTFRPNFEVGGSKPCRKHSARVT